MYEGSRRHRAVSLHRNAGLQYTASCPDASKSTEARRDAQILVRPSSPQPLKMAHALREVSPCLMQCSHMVQVFIAGFTVRQAY
jgi:hypothetical protein